MGIGNTFSICSCRVQRGIKNYFSGLVECLKWKNYFSPTHYTNKPSIILQKDHPFLFPFRSQAYVWIWNVPDIFTCRGLGFQLMGFGDMIDLEDADIINGLISWWIYDTISLLKGDEEWVGPSWQEVGHCGVSWKDASCPSPCLLSLPAVHDEESFAHPCAHRHDALPHHGPRSNGTKGIHEPK
jgi:hypothetical protein